MWPAPLSLLRRMLPVLGLPSPCSGGLSIVDELHAVARHIELAVSACPIEYRLSGGMRVAASAKVVGSRGAATFLGTASAGSSSLAFARKASARTRRTKAQVTYA